MKSFYTWDNDTLILNILGTAGAKRDQIGKVRGDQLKVSVTAAPEAGRATQHMIGFLAKQLGVKIKDVELVFGLTSSNKQFRIKAPKHLPAGITPAAGG